MSVVKGAYQTEGIAIKGPASSSSNGTIRDVDVGMFTDSSGNLVFRDKYITDILNRDGITLKELYNRVRGIYTQLNSAGQSQLYFKDETVSRPYSLQEIVESCSEFRNNRVNGSLWWVGRHEIDHSLCANIPRINEPNGPNRLWSVDRFLAELNGITRCDTISPIDFFELTVDPNTGEPKWWDVQNLEIVLPPSDSQKAVILMSKLAYMSFNSPEPIIFRLYDATAGVELVRTSSINANSGRILYPVPLTYFGPVPTINKRSTFAQRSSTFSSGSITNCEEDCGCNDISCIQGDPYCTISTGEDISRIYGEGAHLIKVQFRVINYHPNHYERVFGQEIANDAENGAPEYLTTSTMDAVIFDISPDSRYSRQHGTETMDNTTSKDVTFETPFNSSSYSLTLTADSNVNVWYSNKTRFGFTINAELPFRGQVDWSVLNLSSGA
jgi:hypothetical protein